MAANIVVKANIGKYYKPWETSAEEDDRIHDQIAEARAIIKREVEEYEATQLHEEGRGASREDNGSPDAKDSHNGKVQDAYSPHRISTTNGASNRSHNSPKDRDMEDQPADSPPHEAVRDDDAAEHAPDTVQSHQTTDDPSNDTHYDHGEDVIEEAAEDTVIY